MKKFDQYCAILRDFLPAFQALATGIHSAYGSSLNEIP
jgi:hypothetical protein